MVSYQVEKYKTNGDIRMRKRFEHIQTDEQFDKDGNIEVLMTVVDHLENKKYELIYKDKRVSYNCNEEEIPLDRNVKMTVLNMGTYFIRMNGLENKEIYRRKRFKNTKPLDIDINKIINPDNNFLRIEVEYGLRLGGDKSENNMFYVFTNIWKKNQSWKTNENRLTSGFQKEITKVIYPDLRDMVRLHNHYLDGSPMNATKIGYHYAKKAYRILLSHFFLISKEEADKIIEETKNNNYTEEQFEENVIPRYKERWKKIAEKALTKYKFG